MFCKSIKYRAHINEALALKKTRYANYLKSSAQNAQYAINL